MNSSERIEQIKARLAEASEGQWVAIKGREADDWGITEANVPGKSIAQMLWEYDADFVAHSRSDIPWLLSQLEEAQREIANLSRERKAAIENLRQETQFHHKKETASRKIAGELAEAGNIILQLVDNNVLVRNTVKDAEVGWAVHQLPLIIGLKKLTEALARFEAEGRK